MESMSPEWFKSTFFQEEKEVPDFTHIERKPLTMPLRRLDLTGVVDVVIVRGDEACIAFAANDAKDLDAVRVVCLEDGRGLEIGQPEGAFIFTSSKGQAVVVNGGGVRLDGNGISVAASGGSVAAGGNVVVNNTPGGIVIGGNVGRVITTTRGDINNYFGRSKPRGAAEQHFHAEAAKAVEVGPILIGLVVPELVQINISSTGSVTFSGIEQDELEIKVSGVGAAHLEGQVDQFQARVSGAGWVDAEVLKARTAKLRVSGSGLVQATVTEDADAKVSGSGEIHVTGDPARRRERVTGSGEVYFD